MNNSRGKSQKHAQIRPYGEQDEFDQLDDEVQVNIVHAVQGGLISQSDFLQSPTTSCDGPLTISIIYEARASREGLAFDSFADYIFNFIMQQSASVDSHLSLFQHFKISAFESTSSSAPTFFSRKHDFDWIIENDAEFKQLIKQSVRAQRTLELKSLCKVKNNIYDYK